MKSHWRRVLLGGALAVLALAAFGAGSHFHAETDVQGEHCVLCHAQDAPFIASGLPANPDAAVRAAVVPVAAPRVHASTPTGGGSRAPPA